MEYCSHIPSVGPGNNPRLRFPNGQADPATRRFLMIRRLLPTIAGISVLFLVIAVALANRAVHAQVSMTANGLPDKGLILIGPADLGFEEKAASVLNGRNDFTYESLKPYSVILQNNSHKAVVA